MSISFKFTQDMTSTGDYINLSDNMSRLEDAIYDCESIIHDITKAQKHADDLNKSLDAIKETAKIKFKELGVCYDEMEREHRGYVETWQEMNPLNMKKRRRKSWTRICSAIHFMKELVQETIEMETPLIIGHCSQVTHYMTKDDDPVQTV